MKSNICINTRVVHCIGYRTQRDERFRVEHHGPRRRDISSSSGMGVE